MYVKREWKTSGPWISGVSATRSSCSISCHRSHICASSLEAHQVFWHRRACGSRIHIYRRRFPHNKDREGSFLVDVVYSADLSDLCCRMISHNEARYRKISFPLDHVFSDGASRSKHPHQSNHIYYT